MDENIAYRPYGRYESHHDRECWNAVQVCRHSPTRWEYPRRTREWTRSNALWTEVMVDLELGLDRGGKAEARYPVRVSGWRTTTFFPTKPCVLSSESESRMPAPDIDIGCGLPLVCNCLKCSYPGNQYQHREHISFLTVSRPSLS